jgi:hypothetical protein
MSKIHFRRTTRRKSSVSQNPLNLGLSVTRQIVSLLGGGRSGIGGAGSALGGIASLLSGGANGVQSTALLQAALTANTTAITANTAAITGESTTGSIGSEGLSLLGGGSSSGGFFNSLLGGFGSLLSIFSLGSSLFSLFSGSKPQQTLTPYRAPFSQSLEVANTGNILAGLPRFDTSADGTPRTYNTGASSTPAQPVQVTVNVSAIDSRSFQDYAPQLADAVRQAMLNLSPINQLIRESL